MREVRLGGEIEATELPDDLLVLGSQETRSIGLGSTLSAEKRLESSLQG